MTRAVLLIAGLTLLLLLLFLWRGLETHPSEAPPEQAALPVAPAAPRTATATVPVAATPVSRNKIFSREQKQRLAAEGEAPPPKPPQLGGP